MSCIIILYNYYDYNYYFLFKILTFQSQNYDLVCRNFTFLSHKYNFVLSKLI